MLTSSRLTRILCQYSLTKSNKITSRIINNKKNVAMINNISQVDFSQDVVEKLAVPSMEEPSPINKFVLRSHTCGELTADNIGDDVKLCGWMEFQRMGKFITLRDSYGSIQLMIPDDNKMLIELVEKLNYESVLSITGKVIARPKGQENDKMKTGKIEIKIDTLNVENNSVAQLPFYIRQHNMPKEHLQMQFRYLSLRFPLMQNNLRIRSNVIHKMRTYLIDNCGFVDVETPTLFKRTPGGAQEFIVPTQEPNKFYSLVQSPQQFKQLLMVGGIDRYFQIARCYRDEGARPDRQPEFTQLDIEMSFVDRQGIINLVEEIIKNSCANYFTENFNIPFKKFTYDDVMELYGTDKPDLRIPNQITNITNLFINDNSNNTNKQNNFIYALSFTNDAANSLTSSTKN